MIFPKANCHVHANGMATDDDVCRLAVEYNVDLSRYSHIRPDGYRIWADGHHSTSHEAYDQTVSLIRKPEDLYGVVKGGLLRDHAQGSLYTHLLSSGLNNCRSSADVISCFEKNMLELVKAIRDVRAATGMEAFISISAKRHLKDGPAQAHRLLDAYEAFGKKHAISEDARFITGFDMAGNEELGDSGDFKDVYERAGRLGLGLGGHFGEVLPAYDIRSALKLGISQGAHMLSAKADPVLIGELRKKKIFIHQLLISNEMLHNYSSPLIEKPASDRPHHPSRMFVDEGLFLGLGSDDPGLQRTHIGHEYDKAVEYGFSPEERLAFTSNSIQFGFMPIEVKQERLMIVRRYAEDSHLMLAPNMFRPNSPVRMAPTA